MATQGERSIRAFVRNAWTLLAFQLVAAAAAVAVTAWATFQVRPLLAERERLTEAIAEAELRVDDLQKKESQARDSLSELEKRAATLRAELKGARASTPILTEAIRAYHKKNYAQAIAKYDEALRLNPGDAYLYNLKSYSQFKAGDFQGAISTLSRALQLDPSYDWGYFDLARYQCAAGLPDAAVGTIAEALKTRGQPIRSGIRFFLAKDGEFVRLCATVRNKLERLADDAGDKGQ